MKRLKICMLLDNPLNPDPRVEKEAKTLAGAGYEVTVYCQKADGLTDYEKKDGYTIRRTFRYKLGTTVKILKYIYAHWELWKSIKEKYDVYHCHDVETWPVGYFFAKRDGARLVYDAHEYFPDMIVKGNYRSILKYYASKVLFYLRGSLFIRKANHVITVNNIVAEQLKKEYQLSKIPVFLYNTRYESDIPSKTSNYLREHYGIKGNETVLYFHGNIDPSRGIEKIFNIISKMNDVKLVVAGKGSKDYLDKLNSLIRELKIEDKVLFLGFVNHQELLNVAASADILLYFPVETVKNISLTTPNKFFDYLFAGKPMVITGLPGILEFMEKNNLGIVISKELKEVDYIAEQINKLIKNKDQYERLTCEYQRAREKAIWEKEATKLLTLYAEIIQ